MIFINNLVERSIQKNLIRSIISKFHSKARVTFVKGLCLASKGKTQPFGCSSFSTRSLFSQAKLQYIFLVLHYWSQNVKKRSSQNPQKQVQVVPFCLVKDGEKKKIHASWQLATARNSSNKSLEGFSQGLDRASAKRLTGHKPQAKTQVDSSRVSFSFFLFFFILQASLAPLLLANVVILNISRFVKSPFRFQLNLIILPTKIKRFCK